MGGRFSLEVTPKQRVLCCLLTMDSSRLYLQANDCSASPLPPFIGRELITTPGWRGAVPLCFHSRTLTDPAETPVGGVSLQSLPNNHSETYC